MFHKVHIIKCGGSEKGPCPYTVEAPRRRIGKAIAQMQAHAADLHHRLVIEKSLRSFRIVDGMPE